MHILSIYMYILSIYTYAHVRIFVKHTYAHELIYLNNTFMYINNNTLITHYFESRPRLANT